MGVPIKGKANPRNAVKILTVIRKLYDVESAGSVSVNRVKMNRALSGFGDYWRDEDISAAISMLDGEKKKQK